ncbi:MAG: VCBS repeat-containing protein, partial [Xanthomonadales bacterium]|nr:VCBS repeat-containing protein [Xanthomonadales bacterium]
MKIIPRSVCPSTLGVALALAFGSTPVAAADSASSPGVDAVIAELLRLEQKREPKCYATASRLEDFMYGTPLSKEARFAKNLLQKQWIEWIWRQSAAAARKQSADIIDVAQVNQALGDMLKVSEESDGHFTVNLNGRPMRINGVDKRQYGSVAYSLRAILAVQQEWLLGDDDTVLFLSEPAVARLAEALDFVTLAALKLTDERMRLENLHEVQRQPLVENWLALTGQPALDAGGDSGASADTARLADSKADLSILRAMIAQKLASYEAYNNVSNQLFMRNLQVYFARARWPRDEAEANAFRSAFTEAMIVFTRDLYLGAEREAAKAGHPSIHEADVAHFAEHFIPHRINEYEDAIFFPRLPRDAGRIEIEAFDMDAFRDPGWHWRYLSSAVNADDFPARLQLDPFAAELLTENVAQFGVLILRVTGDLVRAAGEEEVSVTRLRAAFNDIQSRVNRHATAKETPLDVAPIASSEQSDDAGTGRFVEITADSGIDYQQRNSDWLNRQLRSYLKKGDNTGVITIPPAFGGSGVAAGDINNDGRDDLLLLGGRGARLYLNLGDGTFRDITQTAGIDWRREDSKQPGEMRQPLIADFDNDGRQDIVITYVDDAHRVYRNLGELRFEDVTAQSGLGGKGLIGGPATTFDYDSDGLLDIYVQNFGDYLNGALPTLARRNFNALPDRLFRNLGGFRFEDVTDKAGVGDPGWGQATTHTDLDGDGDQDLISGNDFGVNRYYLNQGDGSFREASAELGTNKPSYTMSIGITDLNRDRAPDIYIANIVTMNKDETYVMPNKDTPAKFNPEKLKTMRVVEANDLFVSGRLDGKPHYLHSDAVGRGRSSTGWSWDADFFDADNDGDDDLYVLNGMNEYNVYSRENPYYTDPIENRRQDVEFPDAGKAHNVYFENRGGRLENASANSGLDFISNSRSAVYLDLEGDGDLDIVTLDYQGPARVFRNDSQVNGNHWLA